MALRKIMRQDNALGHLLAEVGWTLGEWTLDDLWFLVTFPLAIAWLVHFDLPWIVRAWAWVGYNTEIFYISYLVPVVAWVRICQRMNREKEKERGGAY